MTTAQNNKPYFAPANSYHFDQRLLSIPLRESNEPFISLVEEFKKCNLPVHFNHTGSNNGKRVFYLRKSVAIAVRNAAKKLLRSGFIFCIEDAYRSLDVQRRKFQIRVNEIKLKLPDISTKELYLIANTYTAGIPLLAAHTAGAAIDVTLLDTNRQHADMGSPYREFSERAHTDYEGLSQKSRERRSLLVGIMKSEKLINYPFEYWHFSRGDVCAAYMMNQPLAIYGPIFFNEKTQTMSTLSNQDIRSYFTI